MSKQAEKWGIRVLGIVCLALVASLGWRIFASSSSKVDAAQSGAAQRGTASPAKHDDLQRYNPQLNLALLKQIESQPLPKTARNPFEYPPPPAPPVQPSQVAPAPPPPPPPPPPPIKAIGYSVKAGNIPEAVVMDEQDIFVVHVGETFANRYHVLAISPDRVDIQDATTQQTVHLPIAQ
ncbi:MAG: hypothetical protein ACM3NO_02915 [Deltaproteobacteria bacterium]